MGKDAMVDDTVALGVITDIEETKDADLDAAIENLKTDDTGAIGGDSSTDG